MINFVLKLIRNAMNKDQIYQSLHSLRVFQLPFRERLL